MKRRDFLKTGLKIGVAANALPLILGGSPIRALGRSPLRSALETSGTANNNVLVVIQLAGGNDGLNCLVPHNDANYKTLRPTLGLDLTKDSLLVLPDHDTLAFHGSMSGFSQLYGSGGGSGNIAILQNVGYPNPILSHFRGTDIWNTATDSDRVASSGWLGRYLLGQNPGYPPATIQNNSWPLAIEFGNALSNVFLAQAGGMGIALNQFPSQASPGGHNYDAIPSNPTTQYTELDYIRIIQAESEVYTNTIYNQCVVPKIANNVKYPDSGIAKDLASVAKLIGTQWQQAGNVLQTKIYFVTQGGYDTHSTELTNQGKLLSDLSAAVLAFQQDIEAFKVADQVAIMTYSEFGRRPQENGSGTDHGTAAPHFVIGTQVIGKVYGSDPKLDSTSLTAGAGNLTYDPAHDFRNVYATMMNEWLLAGGDQAKINTAITDVISSDLNPTFYSNTSNWQSLGIFKPSGNQYVGSAPDAMGLMLLQNYPNPAYGSTTIQYTLDISGPIELGIFSTDGTEVARIVDGWQSAGPQSANFNADKLASGAYIYRLKTATQNVTRQMAVVH